MRKWLIIIVLLLTSVGVSAQSVEQSGKVKFPGDKCMLYRLTLTDKHLTPYSLDHPELFLSEKAINRRNRQHLPVDSTDLPLPPEYIKRIALTGAGVVGQSKWNLTVLVKVKDQKTVKALQNLPFVRQAEKLWTSPDSIQQPVRSFFHKDFLKWDEPTATPYGQAELQIDLLNGIPLHQRGFKGRGMTIAVFDGGFMNVDRIPCLQKVRVVATRDFMALPSDDLYQAVDHGTKVLSTMAVNVPQAYVGTAPDADYILCRTEDARSETRVEEDYWTFAAEYADSIGVDVINSSLGYHDFNDKTTNYDYTDINGKTSLVSRTASLLASKGIVLVNSAGNDGMGSWKVVGVPADADNILTVGAVNAQRVNAAFSSVGPTADGRVKPDVMSLGSPAAVVTGRGAIVNDMGTSFAAPIMAGMVACLWQARPHLTATEIIQLVRSCGHLATQPNNVYGYGIPDFGKALNTSERK